MLFIFRFTFSNGLSKMSVVRVAAAQITAINTLFHNVIMVKTSFVEYCHHEKCVTFIFFC